jgi:hypothetical protein
METPFPFFNFVMMIGNDPGELKKFLANPDAAPVTAEQKAALLSGSFRRVEALLRKENPDVEKLADALRPPGTLAAGPQQIGWNMASLMVQMPGAKRNGA